VICIYTNEGRAVHVKYLTHTPDTSCAVNRLTRQYPCGYILASTTCSQTIPKARSLPFVACD